MTTLARIAATAPVRAGVNAAFHAFARRRVARLRAANPPF